ncbi:KH domain-containing protein HEN4 [Linum perenne]
MQRNHHSRRRRGHDDNTKQRRRTHRWTPEDLQPGQSAFQIVCHDSAVGGVIGASGSIISKIRDETSCIISFQKPVDGSEHRVVVVIGSDTPERRVVLEEDAGEEVVSDAQDAVLRVVERMWQVYGGRGRRGFCGLLASAHQIGIVVGKGGRTIKKMKKVSEAEINILPPPPCALPDEQLIQITGSVVSVKRAIIIVTGRIQSCPPPCERIRIPIQLAERPFERYSTKSPYDQHLEFFPHLSPMLPPDADSDPELSSTKCSEQEVSFKLLVPDNAAGSIIGTGGTVIRSMENQTGASIQVCPSRTWSGERVVIVSAVENVDSSYSPAQSAALLVFARSVESDFEKPRSSGRTTVSARLLVAMDRLCFLVGRNGLIDADVAQGANVMLHLLEDEQFILQITGVNKNVTKVLTRVINRLRGSVFPSNMLEEASSSTSSTDRVADVTTATLSESSQSVRSRDSIQEDLGSCDGKNEQSRRGTAAIAESSNGNGQSSSSQVSELERCMRFLLPREGLKAGDVKVHNGLGKSAATVGTKMNNQLGLFNSKGASLPELKTSRVITESEKHSSTSKPGAEHERKQPASAVNKTIEVTISADVISAVYGKDGSNLDNIRKVSGAKIAVLDESPGKHEVRIVISGAPGEAKEAESLVHASILRARCWPPLS